MATKIECSLLNYPIERSGQWFLLSRYHDQNFDQNGPHALANFLNLPISDVFPINYDLQPYSVGLTNALIGEIYQEPSERLTRQELIQLAIDG